MAKYTIADVDNYILSLESDILAGYTAEREAAGRVQPTEPESPGLARRVGDIATSFVAGVPRAAGAAVQLAGLIPGVHYVADPIAEGLTDFGGWIEESLSSDYQLAMQDKLFSNLAEISANMPEDAELQDYIDVIMAQGGEVASYIKSNPGQALPLIASSLPYLFGGGVLARGATLGAKAIGGAARGEQAGRIASGAAQVPGVAPLAQRVESLGAVGRGALGEGAIITGATAQEIASESDDFASRYYSIPAGLAGAGITRLGARIAGGADVDTAVARALAGNNPADLMDTLAPTPSRLFTKPLGERMGSQALGTTLRAGRAGLIEAAEEYPQEFIEGVAVNLGTGRPALEDVGGQAALGAVAGFGMGAPMGLRRPAGMQQPAPDTTTAPGALPADTAPGGPMTPEQRQAIIDAEMGVEPGTVRPGVFTPEQAAAQQAEFERREQARQRDLEIERIEAAALAQTAVEVAKPTGVGPARWESIAPKLQGTRQDAEAAILAETDAAGNPVFATKAGVLNVRGKAILAAWESAQAAKLKEAGVAKPKNVVAGQWNKLVGELVGVDNAATAETFIRATPGLAGVAGDRVVEAWTQAQAAMAAPAEPAMQTEATMQGLLDTGEGVAAPTMESEAAPEVTIAADEFDQAFEQKWNELEQQDDASLARAAMVMPKGSQFVDAEPAPADPGVIIGTPAMQRALFFAMQGFMPQAATEKAQMNTQWQRASAQAAGLASLENGQAALDALAQIHALTLEADNNLKKITDTATPAAARNKLISRNNKVAKELQQAFTGLETALGRRNIRKAMAVAKEAASVNMQGFIPENLTPPELAKNRETSAAIRLNRAYRAYSEGRLSEQFTAAEDWRYTTEVQGMGLEPVPRMQAIGMGASRRGATAEKLLNPKYSEAKNILDHIAATAPQAYTRELAQRISAVLEANGLLEKGQIKFEYKTAARNKKGDGAVFAFNKGKKTYAAITFYGDGQNVITALHELVHAATVAAVENKKFQKTASYKELSKIAKLLLAQDAVQVAQKYNDQTGAIIGRLKKAATDGKVNPEIVAEVLSYGLTNEGIQRLLMDNKVPAAQQGYESMTAWKRFISTVKAIFKAYNIKNTQFERFMFASNEFMQEVLTERGALQKPEVYKELASIGAVPPAGDATFDADQMAQDAELRAQAEAAQKAKTEQVAGTNKVRDAEKEAKAAKEKARRAEEAEAAKARAAFQEAEAKKASTLVEKGEGTRDLTSIDRLGRNIFNALLTPFMGRNADWETAANNLWNKTGDIVVNWAKKPVTAETSETEKLLQRGVNRVFANVADEFGTDKMFRGMKFSLTRGLRAQMSDMTNAYETLKTMNREQQYALLQYLANNDDAQLQAILPDAADFQSAKNFAKHLNDMFDTAKAYQLIEAKNLDKSLIDFITLTRRENFGKREAQAVGAISPSTSVKVKTALISTDHVFDKNGKGLTNFNTAAKFKKVLEVGTGSVAYVHQDMTLDTLKSLDMTYDPDEMNNLYGIEQLVKVDNAQDVEFSRLRTAAELEADGVVDTLVASLATAAHDWMRRIEGVRFNETMLNYNKGLDDGDKWIRDEPPEGTPEDRLVDPAKEKARFGRVNANKQRIPGFWVKVPDNKNQWGDLAGKWVSAPVYSSILDAYDDQPLVNIKALRVANTIWKKNKTVWSAVTHMNNIGGNFTLMYYHDLPMANVKTGFRVVIHQMSPELAKKLFKNNPITQREIDLGNEIKAMGVELVAHKYQELDKATVDTLNKVISEFTTSQDNDNSVRSTMNAAIALEKIYAAMVRIDRLFSEVYSNQDNVFRIAAYMKYLQDAQAKGEVVNQTLKEEAGAYARDAFVNYQINAPWINALRQGSVGIALPFLAWTYRMVPLMIKTAMTKPWKIANTYGAIYGLNAAAYMLLGAGADEEEERRNLPSYMQRNAFALPGAPLSIRMPFGEGDKAVFFNVGNMLPLGNVFEFDDNANLPGVLMPGGPIYSTMQVVMNHQAFRGKPITEDLDRFTGQHLADVSNFMWRELGPVALVNGLKFGNDALFDKKGPLGSDPNRMIQAAKLLGINLVQLDWPEQEYMKDLEIKRLQRDLRSKINRAASAYARQGRFADEAGLDKDINKLVDRFEKRLKEMTGEE